jgi:hypothetical protein
LSGSGINPLDVFFRSWYIDDNPEVDDMAAFITRTNGIYSFKPVYYYYYAGNGLYPLMS